MSKSLAVKSLFVLAAFTLGAGSASAEEKSFCFEDGLKNNWSTPAPHIDLGHSEGHGHSGKHGADNHSGGHHGFDRNEFHGNPWGNNGGINVSPVSEPATDAMLLAGLVMVGSLVRRKSKSKTTATTSALCA